MQKKMSMKITTTRRQTVILEPAVSSLVCPVCHTTFHVAESLGTACTDCQQVPCMCSAAGEEENPSLASPISKPSLILIENQD